MNKIFTKGKKPKAFRFKTIYSNGHHSEYEITEEQAIKFLQSGFWHPPTRKGLNDTYTYKVLYEKGRYVCVLTEKMPLILME